MSAQLMFKQQVVKGILFDLDGTLLDTASDLGAAVNHLLQRDGLPLLGQQIISQTASQGALALIKAGYGEVPAEALARLRQEFLDYYELNLANQTRFYPGVESLLSTLNQRAIPWGIITNKPYVYTKALFNKFELLATSHVTLCGDSMAVRKPNPQPLLVAAKSLAIVPQQLIYLGDALTDIEAANSAQMISAIAKYGYIAATENLELWHANLILNNCNDLIAVLTQN